jgi:hypothetical protein
MSEERHIELQCSQFEALLAEFLEFEAAGSTGSTDLESGMLAAEQKRAFDAHRQACPACGPLYQEAREGMLLLRSLEEVDPPRHLVHNILAATSLAEAPAKTEIRAVTPGWQESLQKVLRPALGRGLSPLLHSRFAMSFCMAFFSLSLTLSLAGVRVPDLYRMVSHPNTLGRSMMLQYTQMEAKVVRYYENMRIVYQVQSKVQQLKKNAPQINNKPEQQNRKNSVPGDKERDRENYSMERDGNLVAVARLHHEGAQI